VGEDTYTVAEAAKILRYAERHVRKLLADGELEGERDEESGHWRVCQHSVHAVLPQAPAARRAPAGAARSPREGHGPRREDVSGHRPSTIS
jgi:excisionase family DNA binding protein